MIICVHFIVSYHRSLSFVRNFSFYSCKYITKEIKKFQGYKRDFMEGKEIFRTLKFLDCNHLQLIETESFFSPLVALVYSLEWNLPF